MPYLKTRTFSPAFQDNFRNSVALLGHAPSKRGNPYLRKLFVQGARAVLQVRTKQDPGLSRWLEDLTSRKHGNVAVIALANKLARIAWAVLVKGKAYQPRESMIAAAA